MVGAQGLEAHVCIMFQPFRPTARSAVVIWSFRRLTSEEGFSDDRRGATLAFDKMNTRKRLCRGETCSETKHLKTRQPPPME